MAGYGSEYRMKHEAHMAAEEKQQAEWKRENDALRRRRLAKREAERKRQAAEQREVDAMNADLKASHLQMWLSNGGTESEFEKQWPEVRLRILDKRMLAERNAHLFTTTPTWRG